MISDKFQCVVEEPGNGNSLLYNGAGLTAMPFRTADWQWLKPKS